MGDIKKHIKLVVVGDGAVGKTTLLYAYKNKRYVENYMPMMPDPPATTNILVE